eukprot:6175742-Pleurochrysis_carterae.AAC.3
MHVRPFLQCMSASSCNACPATPLPAPRYHTSFCCRVIGHFVRSSFRKRMVLPPAAAPLHYSPPILLVLSAPPDSSANLATACAPCCQDSTHARLSASAPLPHCWDTLHSHPLPLSATRRRPRTSRLATSSPAR